MFLARDKVDIEKVLAEILGNQQKIMNKQLELEQKINLVLEDKDRREKEELTKVWGLTIIKNGKYYHAVRTIDGSTIRIYIGKSKDEDIVKSKIAEWLKWNSWARDSLAKIVDLGEIESLLER